MLIINLLLGYMIAFLAGKLISKLKFPQILGWLLAGVIIGPNVIGIISKDAMAIPMFKVIMNFSKTIVGIMVGYSMVFKKLKKAGSKYLKITLSEMLGAALFVFVVFLIAFVIMGIPWPLAILIGLVALPTAPGVNISLISEFKAEGRFTDILKTVTGLDNILANIIFYVALALVQAIFSAGVSVNVSMFNMMALPAIIGLIFGLIASILIKISNNSKTDLMIFVGVMIAANILAFYVDNYILENPSMNFIIIGILYSTVYVNMVSDEKLLSVKRGFHSIQEIGLMCLVFSLGLPLNPKLIPDHFLILITFIIVRGLGKIIGGYVGSSLANEPDIVKKTIGITMTPSAGVALVFFNNAATTATVLFPEYIYIFTVALPASVIINDVVGILLSKYAYIKTGETNK